MHTPLHDVPPECSHTFIGVGPQLKVLRSVCMMRHVAYHQHKGTTPTPPGKGGEDRREEERGKGEEGRITLQDSNNIVIPPNNVLIALCTHAAAVNTQV